MNQILSFKTSENGQKILKNNTKHLGIFLMLFAILLIGAGTWRLYENFNKKVDVYKPEITGNIKSNKTIFYVNSQVGIKKIIYAWNNGQESSIDKNGEKEFSFEVDNPIGVNELAIKSVDVDGNTIIYDNIKVVYDEEANPENSNGNQNTVEPENPKTLEELIAEDSNPPTIALSADTGKVVINASDDVRMDYVTYRWNDGEEVKITGLSEDEKSLTAKIDLLKGDNILKVKAYDKAGNVKEHEQKVHGTKGPDIAVTRDETKITIKVSDEYGISKIEYNFNNEEKTISNIEGTTYEISLDLVDGENFIIINAYEGTVKTQYSGKTTK